MSEHPRRCEQCGFWIRPLVSGGTQVDGVWFCDDWCRRVHKVILDIEGLPVLDLLHEGTLQEWIGAAARVDAYGGGDGASGGTGEGVAAEPA